MPLNLLLFLSLYINSAEEDHYKPKTKFIFYSNNYVEYKSNGYRNKNLSLKEFLDKIKPYLRELVNDRQESDTWKI